MKGSLIVVLFFALGCFVGWLGSGSSNVVDATVVVEHESLILDTPGVTSPNDVFGEDESNNGWLPSFLTGGALTTIVLYFLMLQVGLSIGSDKKLKEIWLMIKLKYFLFPWEIIFGTLPLVV